MTALHDGRVMVVGGVSSGDCAWKGFSDRSEIWDPATGAFTTSETMTMAVPRVAAAVVILSDGRVLAAGGWNRCGTVYDSVEVFDPVTETWTQAGELNVPRYAAAPLLLPDGRVLLAGFDVLPAPVVADHALHGRLEVAGHGGIGVLVDRHACCRVRHVDERGGGAVGAVERSRDLARDLDELSLPLCF